jgi:hypothetical protein
MRTKLAAVLALVAVAVAATAVSAQGREEALPGIPAYAQGFERWTKINSKPIPPRAEGDAHLGLKNIYVNRPRSALVRGGKQRFPYPNGAIVVKAAKRPGKSFIGLVAIMRKIRGSDRAHGDWQFVEYTREARSARFREIASDAVCWSCHVGARKTDWAFTTFR